MFGLFTPKCPVELDIKTWTERTMLWFTERFGSHRLANCVTVTPTDAFFPDRYEADERGARACFERVCGYMGADSSALALEVVPDEDLPNAAGIYDARAARTVCVARSQLSDPTRLVATLAHEVSHDILLQGGHLTGTEPDHEHITDLLPVYLGLGIFGANATIRERVEFEGMNRWLWTSVQGYHSSIVLGYALALFAFGRREIAPEWAQHLRTDARKTLASGLRFLEKTGDSLFTPKTIGKRRAATAGGALDALASASPTARLSALWDVAESKLSETKLLGPVLRALSEREPAMRAAGARALPVFGAVARDSVPRLVAALGDPVPGVRAPAAVALGEMRPAASDTVPELARLLLDTDTAPAAAHALRAYGAEAGACLPQLLVALERSLTTYTSATPGYFAILRTISSEPERTLRNHFGARDPELLGMALRELASPES